MKNKRIEEAQPCMYNKDGKKNCPNSSYGGGRGLCNMHYTLCRFHVKNRNKTWEQFEEEGVCKKKMTQKEKNERQSHPHKEYRRREQVVKPNDDF